MATDTLKELAYTTYQSLLSEDAEQDFAYFSNNAIAACLDSVGLVPNYIEENAVYQAFLNDPNSVSRETFLEALLLVLPELHEGIDYWEQANKNLRFDIDTRNKFLGKINFQAIDNNEINSLIRDYFKYDCIGNLEHIYFGWLTVYQRRLAA